MMAKEKEPARMKIAGFANDVGYSMNECLDFVYGPELARVTESLPREMKRIAELKKMWPKAA
jgi:hypothetical protein